MVTFGGNCVVKITLRLFQPLFLLCCYDHGAKSSEAVQKIATDQREYHRCPSCAIICCVAKIYLSINSSEKRLVSRTPPMQLKRLLKSHRKKSNTWPMVSFIHNGSEITTWMWYSFKNTKSKTAFFEFQAADHQISTRTLGLYTNSLTLIHPLNQLLYIGLMLTIGKVFTFLLLCLCENREYPASFQNKLVSSSFK